MNARPRTKLPLAGIRVIDFTQVMMGPVCTQMLGDYGADVIKIERAGRGRPVAQLASRRSGRASTTRSSAASTATSAAIALDLRDAGDKAAVLKALIADADVVVNNFRAGVMERMGLGYEALREAQPAHHLRRRHRLRPDRALRAQGRPGRAGAGDDRRDGAPLRRRACRSRSIRRRFADYSAGMHLVQGDPARAAAARAHGRRPAVACRSSTPCSRRRCRKRRCYLMRGREVNWAAMPLPGVFECSQTARW